MTPLRWLSILALVCACDAPKTPVVDTSMAPPAPPAAKAPGPYRTTDEKIAWHFENAQRTVLYYGEEGTDNTSIGFNCSKEHPDIGFDFVADAARDQGRDNSERWPTHLAMASGPVSARFVVEAVLEDSERPVLLGAAEPSDPLLRAFEASGKLRVEGHTQDADSAYSRESIKLFFDACRKLAG